MIHYIGIGGDPYTGKRRLLRAISASLGDRIHVSFGKTVRFFQYNGPCAIVIECGDLAEIADFLHGLAGASVFQGWTVLSASDKLFCVRWIDEIRSNSLIECRWILLEANRKVVRRRIDAAVGDTKTEFDYASAFGRVANVKKKTGRYGVEIWPHDTDMQSNRLALELCEEIVSNGSAKTDG